MVAVLTARARTAGTQRSNAIRPSPTIHTAREASGTTLAAENISRLVKIASSSHQRETPRPGEPRNTAPPSSSHSHGSMMNTASP